MVPDLPLTSLCAICYTNPPIYTCPRCNTHTCSLSCVKKHKSQAPCSGIRNPAEYRGIKELKSASSVDRDYNFLVGLERGVVVGGEVKEKVLPVVKVGGSVGGGGKGQKTRLEMVMEARGIKWVRAPEGLSRRRENKTHPNGKDGVVWTVEWFGGNGERKVKNCMEERTVGDWVDEVFRGKKETMGKGRKRKRDVEAIDGGVGGTDEVQGDGDTESQAEIKEKRAEVDSKGIDNVNTESNGIAAHSPIPPQGEEQPENVEGNNIISNGGNEGDPTPSSRYIYLHRPRTSSKIKVLIPISEKSTLKEVLMERIILEFPTIHIREESPDTLPAPYMVEETYLQQFGEDVSVPIPHPDALVKDDVEDGELVDSSAVPLDELLTKIDSASVLNALKSDITTFV